MKLVFLGAGAIANETAMLVRKSFKDLDLVIADIDLDRAEAVAKKVAGRALQFDATDPLSIAETIKDADLVFNAVGPFYRFGLGIIQAAIANKVNYIDICDEYDVTLTLVEDKALDQAAKDANIFALFGMGFSPGITNLVAKWACNLLDAPKTVEIASSIPYWPNLGMTVNDHMLYSMSGNVPQFVNGKIEYLPAWGGEKEYIFKGEHGRQIIGYMGHPEGVSLGYSIKGLENASIRFRWVEEEGNQIWKSFARLGLTEGENRDLPIGPREYLARYMSSEAGMQQLDLKVDEHAKTNVFQINAKGIKDGKTCTVAIEYHGTNEHSDPTPYAAAAAIVEALNGRIIKRGVIPAEVAIEEPDKLAQAVLKAVNNKIYLTKTIEEIV